MSELMDLQRRVAAVVMSPLTASENMQRRHAAEAAALVKPNDRLTSFERLEIYNRQYWFRVLSCFAEDFPGLRAIVGAKRFETLARAYLIANPSISFTLRNLGARLPSWLCEQHESALAVDMARLEWAHVEVFDELRSAPLGPAEIAEEVPFTLQPCVRLLRLDHAVDDLLIDVRQYQGDSSTASNNARTGQLRRRVRKYAMPAEEPIYVAVHRFEDSVYYKRLQREAFQMLSAIAKQQPLEEGLAGAFAGSSTSEEARLTLLQQWFQNWAELGWFCRATN